MINKKMLKLEVILNNKRYIYASFLSPIVGFLIMLLSFLSYGHSININSSEVLHILGLYILMIIFTALFNLPAYLMARKTKILENLMRYYMVFVFNGLFFSLLLMTFFFKRGLRTMSFRNDWNIYLSIILTFLFFGVFLRGNKESINLE